MEKVYLAIDLKSFYASVECIARGLDPLNTHLVVADQSRTEKTICLAVSPSLKAYGVPGRPRLFEVTQQVERINNARRQRAPGQTLLGASHMESALRADPALALDVLIAKPQMARYMQISTEIYKIYLQYVAPEDIHVYSIDEVFIDATGYLRLYHTNPHDFAMLLIRDVLRQTGITATAGIGSNLYLAKVAMDIMAKKMPADPDGVRVAALDEGSYRQSLWDHRPLTDFWRIGHGYAQKLAENGLYTMGDIARCSVGRPTEHYNEELLYRLFGVNAELLIDHAWGWEPCTLSEIKAYRPAQNSLSIGQVLTRAYTFEEGLLIAREMTDLLVLDLVKKGLVTDQLVLHIGYDIENLKDPVRRAAYHGPVTCDPYGRTTPKAAHGTVNLPAPSASTRELLAAATKLYRQIVDPALSVRRINVVANRVVPEATLREAPFEQLNLFTDYSAREAAAAARQKERSMQRAILEIQEKFGKNAILKGMNFKKGATTRERNGTIGGHKA